MGGRTPQTPGDIPEPWRRDASARRRSQSDAPPSGAVRSAQDSRPQVPRGPLTDHLIVHLIEGERTYPRLRRVLEAGGYTEFEIVGESKF